MCVCYVNIVICIYYIVLKKYINILHIYLYDTNVYILGWVWFVFNNIYILSIIFFLSAFKKNQLFSNHDHKQTHFKRISGLLEKQA